MISCPDSAVLAGKYVYLDNDFLGEIFKDEDLLQESLEFFKSSYLTIDTFTSFEFLRDMYVPKELSVREEFLASDIFVPAIMHQEQFIPIQENGLLLSKIFSHNGTRGSSLADLLLAGRVMLNSKSSLVVTGNAKDFPPPLFNPVAIINKRNPTDGGIRSFPVLGFDAEKFLELHEKLMKLK